MSGMETLRGLFMDAGYKRSDDADRRAADLYSRIRREVFHDLAVSDDDGYLALMDLGNQQSDEIGEPLLSHDEIDALWHRIRSAALAGASESLSWHSERAGHTKVQWTLDWAARKIHKMIIDPGGNHMIPGHTPDNPVGDGPHPTPEESADKVAEFDRNDPGQTGTVPPLPPTQPGPGTDAHGNRKH